MSKILVIEDEKSVRSNILELLEAEGFEPIEAEGGRIGLALAQQLKPDLILCDVMMADLGGFEVLSELRQDPTTAMIPFIFVTAKTTRSDLRQGMQLGADDYLTKPFTRQELLDAIGVRMTRHLTSQKQLAQLRTQVESLQELNLLKDDLISSLSHDLRTPLMNMKMAIEMLRIAPDSPQREHYLEILRKECLREADLVNNLLELQRLESPHTQLQWEPIVLGDWLQTLVSRFEVRLNHAQQHLYLIAPEQMPTLICDRQSLERIVAELLNNACKYTPIGGTIEIHTDQDPITETIRLQVSNSAAIPTEALPHLFEKFYRIPRSDVRKQGGSGLGLAVVQQLTHKLSGDITVNSTKGWTTFTIALPQGILEDA